MYLSTTDFKVLLLVFVLILVGQVLVLAKKYSTSSLGNKLTVEANMQSNPTFVVFLRTWDRKVR